jgi:DNA-binding PadR family transcriptional regulator
VGKPPEKPNLATTSWALLGMLSYDLELSGYDIRKWINWSMRSFYGRPAYSQIYSELKKLEELGLVTSRVEDTDNARNRRLYTITAPGRDAVSHWVSETPAVPAVLKHPVLLRMTFGHLSTPGRLKEILQDHLAYVEEMQRRSARRVRWAAAEPEWAYARLALQWAQRYHAFERELTLKTIQDLNDAQTKLAQLSDGRQGGIPWPAPEFWRDAKGQAGADDSG